MAFKIKSDYKDHSFLILSFILPLLEHMDQVEKNNVKNLRHGAINRGSESNDASRVWLNNVYFRPL